MSDKYIGKELTKELIVTKTKSNNLESIKNLNLWGNQLENLSILKEMPNLEVISLSVNKICSLRDFRHCEKLQELYLRKNAISDLTEIKYLIKLPALKVLWLFDNPCAQTQNYRQIVISHLPNIDKLDNNPVTKEEKDSVKNKQRFIAPYSEQQKKVEPKKQQKIPHTIQPNIKPQKTVEKQEKAGYNSDQISQKNRNTNILMAVLSLMKQLDFDSLKIVRKQAETMLNNQF